MNYSRFLNTISLSRKRPSWTPFKYLKLKPNKVLDEQDLFVFEEAKFGLRDGSTLHINKDVFQAGLKYTSSAGNEGLINWLKDFQLAIHNPPIFNKAPSGIALTSGSMEALSKTFEMLVDPKDHVLLEMPTYSGVLSSLLPLGCNIHPIETDHQGIVPHILKNTLHGLKSKGLSPKFLYTIPNGTNPTGASTSIERKKEIYEMARESDLLILEDDPYFFLQFCMPRVDSYLSMDTDGRVLRFDSFSKIISSGLRLGFVTGPQPLVDKIVMHLEVSSVHASHISQVVAYELLKKWGMEGFEAHMSKVVEFYASQKDLMIKCAEKWLKGLAEWNEPSAGMFLWIKLNTISNTKKIIEEKAKEKNVLLVPGCAFYHDDTQPTPYVRASYSLCSEEEMDKGFERLNALITEENLKAA